MERHPPVSEQNLLLSCTHWESSQLSDQKTNKQVFFLLIADHCKNQCITLEMNIYVNKDEKHWKWTSAIWTTTKYIRNEHLLSALRSEVDIQRSNIFLHWLTTSPMWNHWGKNRSKLAAKWSIQQKPSPAANVLLSIRKKYRHRQKIQALAQTTNYKSKTNHHLSSKSWQLIILLLNFKVSKLFTQASANVKLVL